MRGVWCLSLLLVLGIPVGARELSAAKRAMLETERAALAEPFKGITADGVVIPGLFDLHSTGRSAKRMRDAATALIESFSSEQRTTIIFAADDIQWRRWSNAPPTLYDRQGVSFKDMTPVQREAAVAMLRASLSEKGWRQARDIMRLDPYEAGSYWIAMMGRPSANAPWGWQLEGHHLAINYFAMGDQVVVTPLFMGAEPVIASTGKYKGTTVLQAEQNKGLVLIRALSDAQRARAVIDASKRGANSNAEAFKDNVVLPYTGIPAAELTNSQQRKLLDLIGVYVGNMRAADAKSTMNEVKRHLDGTYFAWIGGVEANAVFYYRVHSPVILIEFDHQLPFGLNHLEKGTPTREHIHSVMRTPNGNDYGKALLRNYYERRSALSTVICSSATEGTAAARPYR